MWQPSAPLPSHGRGRTLSRSTQLLLPLSPPLRTITIISSKFPAASATASAIPPRPRPSAACAVPNFNITSPSMNSADCAGEPSVTAPTLANGGGRGAAPSPPYPLIPSGCPFRGTAPPQPFIGREILPSSGAGDSTGTSAPAKISSNLRSSPSPSPAADPSQFFTTHRLVTGSNFGLGLGLSRATLSASSTAPDPGLRATPAADEARSTLAMQAA
mmetsp:Transcript_25120/g.49958  ORF Transcript_25120/g.49958 Transcript_25120/m.49958 type:complete len:216 (+) Transcript_25120:248-895(+)